MKVYFWNLFFLNYKKISATNEHHDLLVIFNFFKHFIGDQIQYTSASPCCLIQYLDHLWYYHRLYDEKHYNKKSICSFEYVLICSESFIDSSLPFKLDLFLNIMIVIFLSKEKGFDVWIIKNLIDSHG